MQRTRRSTLSARLMTARTARDSDLGSVAFARDLSVTTDRLGDALLRTGQGLAALDAFRQSLAIRERLAKADPANVQRQSDLVISLNRIGDTLMGWGAPPKGSRSTAGLVIAERWRSRTPKVSNGSTPSRSV